MCPARRYHAAEAMTALTRPSCMSAPIPESPSTIFYGFATFGSSHLPCRGPPLESWREAKRSFKNLLLGVAKYTFHILKHPVHDCGAFPSTQVIVHVVKGGETLTYISKKYGVSIYAIALANSDIVDLDLVMEGQHLYIPTRAQKCLLERKQICGYTLDKCSAFLIDHLKPESQFFSTVTSYCPPYMAKHTGKFCILFPTFAVCIICMIKAFQVRNHRLPAEQGLRKGCDSSALRSPRWRTVLAVETMNIPADETVEEPSEPFEEDQTLPSEEISIAYTSLEPKYRKFLADCGMGRWGYWRGGAPN